MINNIFYVIIYTCKFAYKYLVIYNRMAESKEITNDENMEQTTKRENCIVWDDYFMGIAVLAAKRSKDPCTRVGACIVDKNKKVVSLGYNGMPMGCHDDEFPWGKNNEDPLKNKHTFVCHAELNAIVNKKAADITNCTMYVVLFPCNECAKLIIQVGLKEIVYLSDKHAHKPSTIASKLMFDAASIKYRPHVPERKSIEIDLTKIYDTPESTLYLEP